MLVTWAQTHTTIFTYQGRELGTLTSSAILSSKKSCSTWKIRCSCHRHDTTLPLFPIVFGRLKLPGHSCGVEYSAPCSQYSFLWLLRCTEGKGGEEVGSVTLRVPNVRTVFMRDKWFCLLSGVDPLKD